MTTNLASKQETTPAVTGCPVHWVADLATTSEPAQAPVIREGSPDPKEVREFFELYKEHSTLTDAEWRLRVQDVVAEIAETGTYVHTAEELTVGARLAWRHNTRCIGKLYWRGLTVRDLRDVTDAEGIAEGCLDHGEFVFNKRPDQAVDHDLRARRARQARGEGVEQPADLLRRSPPAGRGQIVGDPNTVAITDLAKKHGWAPAQKVLFDILPIIVETSDGAISVHDVPQGLAHEVEIEHPSIPGLAELGLRWWGFPSISDNVLSIGGINYPCAPFTGWYLAPEIFGPRLHGHLPVQPAARDRRGARDRHLRRPLTVEGQGRDRAHGRGPALLRQGRHPDG